MSPPNSSPAWMMRRQTIRRSKLRGRRRSSGPTESQFRRRRSPRLATDKAAALCFSLVNNHPFVDGNKRVGHAATETFLILNGSEIEASVDEQERLMLELASGRLTRDQLAAWLLAHLRQTG